MEPEKTLLKEFIEGGWVITLIGAAAMLARIMTIATKTSILDQVKKIFVAAICSTIAWAVLEQTDISSIYKAIIYGVIGVISPEIINGLVLIGRKFQTNPLKFFRK